MLVVVSAEKVALVRSEINRCSSSTNAEYWCIMNGSASDPNSAMKGACWTISTAPEATSRAKRPSLVPGTGRRGLRAGANASAKRLGDWEAFSSAVKNATGENVTLIRAYAS